MLGDISKNPRVSSSTAQLPEPSTTGTNTQRGERVIKTYRQTTTSDYRETSGTTRHYSITSCIGIDRRVDLESLTYVALQCDRQRVLSL